MDHQNIREEVLWSHGPAVSNRRRDRSRWIGSVDRPRLPGIAILVQNPAGKLHALSNEVVDIELVLRQVAAVFEERGNDPVFQAHVSSVPKLLESAHSKLEELVSIIETLSASCRGNQAPLSGAYTWWKTQPRLQGLQEDIRSIKCNLNIILGASNSYVPLSSDDIDCCSDNAFF